MGVEVVIAVVSLVVSVGSAIYSASITPDDPDDSGAHITKQGTTATKNVVYGRCLSSCVSIWNNVYDTNNEYLVSVFQLGGFGRLHSIHNVYIDDKRVILSDQNFLSDPTIEWDGFFSHKPLHLGEFEFVQPIADLTGDFRSQVKMQLRSGSGGNRNLSIDASRPANEKHLELAEFYGDGEWTPDHRGDGVPQICIVAKRIIGEDGVVIMGDTYPVMADVSGVEVFDVRDSTWKWSANPSLALYDYLTSVDYGMAIPTEYINADSFINVANICDSYGYEINAEVNTQQQHSETLTKLLSTFQGCLVQENGQLLVKFEGISTPVADFNDDNILSQIQITDQQTNGYFNAIEIKYKNYSANEKEESYVLPADIDNDARIAKDGFFQSTSFDMLYTIDGRTTNGDGAVISGAVHDFAAREYNRTFFQKSIKFDVDLNEDDIRIWDIITVSNEILGWTDRKFRVSQMSKSVNDDKLNIATITASWYDDAIYDSVAPNSGGISRTKPMSIPSPVDLTFNLNTFSSNGYGTFTWQSAYNSPNRDFDVEYKISSQDGWVSVGRTSDLKWIFSNLKPNSYDFRVRVFDSTRGSSDWTYLSDVDISPNATFPPVTGVGVSSLTEDFDFFWDDMTNAVVYVPDDDNPDGAQGDKVKDFWSCYEVDVYHDDGVGGWNHVGTYNTTSNNFIYTYDKNLKNGLNRSVRVDVTIKGKDGTSSQLDSQGGSTSNATNAPPVAPDGVNVTGTIAGINVEWVVPPETDYVGTLLYISLDAEDSPTAAGSYRTAGGNYYFSVSDLALSSIHYVYIAHYDKFGDSDIVWSPVQQGTPRDIDALLPEFPAELQSIRDTNSSQNILGEVVFTTSSPNEKHVAGFGLYAKDSGSTQMIVAADELVIATGGHAAHQPDKTYLSGDKVSVSVGDLIEELYVANINVPSGVAITDETYWTLKLSNTFQSAFYVDASNESLYIRNATIKDLDAGKITFGTMHGDRIQSASISSDHIAAGAIEADHIAAGAISANKINLGDLPEEIDNSVAALYAEEIAIAKADDAISAVSTLSLVAVGEVDLLGNSVERNGNTQTDWSSQVYSREICVGSAIATCTIASGGVDNIRCMFGLNSDPETTPSYYNIDYAIYVDRTKYVCYESGSNKGTILDVSPKLGDTLNVSYDGVEVKYIINGVICRTIDAPSGLQLSLDSSFVNTSCGLKNIQLYSSVDLYSSEQRAAEDATTKSEAAKAMAVGQHNILPDAGFAIPFVDGKPIAFQNHSKTLTAPITNIYRDSDDVWGLNYGGLTGEVYQGTPEGDSGLYADLYTDKYPVEGGQKICYSIYTGAHRCNVKAFTRYRDKDGVHLAYGQQPMNLSENGGGSYLTGYKRLVVMDTVPADARTVECYIRKYDTDASQTSSYLFFVKPQLSYLSSSSLEVPVWVLGDVGSTYYAEQAETNAKDYIDGNFVTSALHDQDLTAIQNQIDGSITNWFYAGVPTLNNVPANAWSTSEDKQLHVGDLYYDEVSGNVYRFQVVQYVYSWVQIANEGIAAALALAKVANDTADSKRRVFVVTPTVPYDAGDLWDTGSGVKRCTQGRTSESSYFSGDWIYITDAAGAAIAVESAAKNYTDASGVGVNLATLNWEETSVIDTESNEIVHDVVTLDPDRGLIEGDIITYSGEIKIINITSGHPSARLRFTKASDGTYLGGAEVTNIDIGNTEWQSFSVTSTLPVGLGQVQARVGWYTWDGDSGEVLVRRVQVERGASASPANVSPYALATAVEDAAKNYTDSQSTILHSWEGDVAIPTSTTIDNAHIISFTSSKSGKANLGLTGLDFEGGVRVACNGTELGSMRDADNATTTYTFVCDVVVGVNTLAVWSNSADGGSLFKVDVIYAGVDVNRNWDNLNANYPSSDKIQIKSNNYSSGADGWAIDSDGNAEFGNIIARGHIEATSGSFSGSLDVKSADTGSRIEIVGDRINVYDGTTLKLRIGRL